MAFTLRRLYERFGGDGRLTLAEYESIGRLDGAVREEAERIITEEKPSQEDLDALHAAFVPTMVRINAEGAYARRRALLDDLPRRVLALLRRFIDARLLVTDRDSQGRETSEVAHEALLRTWPQLSDWLMEDRDKLRLLESLQRAAEEWEQGGRRNDLVVHRDGRLKDAEALAADAHFAMPESSIERHYLSACVAAQSVREAAEREEQERRVRDAERIAKEQTRAAEAQKRTATIARRFTFVASGLLVIAVLAAMAAYLARNEAERQSDEATAAKNRVTEVQQLARHTRDIGSLPQRGLLLSVRAALLAREGRAGELPAIDGLRQQLRTIGGQALHGHDKATRAAAISPDRHWLATASEDGAIRLWKLDALDPASRSFPLAGHTAAVHGLAFSPDGRWLVSGGADGSVRTWRLTAEGAEAGRVYGEGRYGAVHALAISPRGDWLVFGTQSGKVCIWRLSADGPIEAPCEAWADDEPVMKVQFSLGGRWLATICSGACKGFSAPVRLWDLTADFPNQAPRHLTHTTELTEDSLTAIAFNADETRLAAAYGYAAEVWDLTQENPPAHRLGPYASGGGWVSAVALSPDSHWLAISNGGDARVMLWDLTGARTEPIELKGHSAGVNDVAFSADGRWLATGSEDATARLWDLASPTNPGALLRGQDLAVHKVLFSPGAAPRHLVALGDEPSARLFGIPDTLADPVVLRGGAKPVIIGMAVSADGQWIATSSLGDAKLMLWSAADPRGPQHELPLSSPSHAIAFSANGRWLAAKSQDKGVISLWRLADLSQPPLMLSENEWGDVSTLRFSPDSRWMVSGTWGGTVNLWDVSGASPSLEPRHRCPQGVPVREPAFSADGRHLATASHGRSAYLWDLTANDPCAAPRTLPHGDVVYQAVISPDGRWAATAGFDRKGKLWDLAAGAEPKLTSETAFKDRVLQAAFDPAGRWAAFGSWDRTLKLIDLKNPGALAPVELSGHAGRIASVSFSQDGKWLVSASEDGTVRQWDPAEPSAAPVVLRGHEARVAHVAISPDSRWVISAAYDGTVRLWRLQLSDLIDFACRTAGRLLTPEESRIFLSDEHAPQPCAGRTAMEASSGG
ncbi:WD domain, G-beta repeat [compost metagenome]